MMKSLLILMMIVTAGIVAVTGSYVSADVTPMTENITESMVRIFSYPDGWDYSQPIDTPFEPTVTATPTATANAVVGIDENREPQLGTVAISKTGIHLCLPIFGEWIDLAWGQP